jgi:hypothetical protein
MGNVFDYHFMKQKSLNNNNNNHFYFFQLVYNCNNMTYKQYNFQTVCGFNLEIDVALQCGPGTKLILIMPLWSLFAALLGHLI